MTVADNYEPVLYLGNGTTTSFPFAFSISNEDELVVISRLVSTGVDTVVPTADYTVVGDFPGPGTVEYTPAGGPLTAANQLVIARSVEFSQDMDITSQGGFHPTVLENQLDAIERQVQQLHEQGDRSLHMRVKTAATSLQLPEPEPDMLFGWDETGLTIENKPSESASVAAAEAAAAAAEETLAQVQAIFDAFTLATEDGVGTLLSTTANGVSVSYPLSSTVPVNGVSFVNVYFGGVLQKKDGLDYTITDVGTTITPGVLLGAGVTVYVERASTFAVFDTSSTFYATAEEAAAGINNAKSMTPLRAEEHANAWVIRAKSTILAALNVQERNTDNGFSFATTATTQNFMPAGTFGGSWKAAHVTSSTDAAVTAGTRSTAAYTREVLGSGGNNPLGDYTLFLTAKNTVLTDSTLGELGALRMLTFANGRGDKDLFIGSCYKHQGDGTINEGAALAFELGTRIFQNNNISDIVTSHQILGAFVPNPASTWGAETSIGYLSAKTKGAGFSHFQGVDNDTGLGSTMTYLLAGFNLRDIATKYFSIAGTTGDIDTNGSIEFRPKEISGGTPLPTANGDVIFRRDSNTSLRVIMRGTDGVVRSNALVLA